MWEQVWGPGKTFEPPFLRVRVRQFGLQTKQITMLDTVDVVRITRPFFRHLMCIVTHTQPPPLAFQTPRDLAIAIESTVVDALRPFLAHRREPVHALIAHLHPLHFPNDQHSRLLYIGALQVGQLSANVKYSGPLLQENSGLGAAATVLLVSISAVKDLVVRLDGVQRSGVLAPGPVVVRGVLDEVVEKVTHLPQVCHRARGCLEIFN